MGDFLSKETVCCVSGKVKHLNRLSTTRPVFRALAHRPQRQERIKSDSQYETMMHHNASQNGVTSSAVEEHDVGWDFANKHWKFTYHTQITYRLSKIGYLKRKDTAFPWAWSVVGSHVHGNKHQLIIACALITTENRRSDLGLGSRDLNTVYVTFL